MLETLSVFYIFILAAFCERVIHCIAQQPIHPQYFNNDRRRSSSSGF